MKEAFLVRGVATLYLFKEKKFEKKEGTYTLPFEWFPELKMGQVAEIEIKLIKIT